MKKSPFKKLISSGVIRSNFKRLMPIIFLGIAYFFFLYVFPGFFVENIRIYLRDELSYSMVGVRFYCAAMPLIVSLALFNFLHRKNAVLFHHSIPVTRSQMYFSLVLTGLLLINIPLLIFGLYVSAMLSIGVAVKVIAIGFIASTFVFAICTLAGLITGTTIMHFIVACWFNFLPQSIYFVLTSFGEGLLNGFSNENQLRILAKMSPETNAFDVVSYMSLIYIGIAIVIFAVTYGLYKRLQLERAENAIVFNGIKIVLNVIVSIYFMALMGLIVYGFKHTAASFIIGSVIGAILGVYLGYIVLNKTFKIFTIKTFRMACVLVCLSMLLSVAFVYDVFGYEKRIPHVNDVTGVKVEGSLFDRVVRYDGERKAYQTKENITNVINIHHRCTELGKVEVDYSGEITYLDISYTLKNGETLKREYHLPPDDAEVNKYQKKLFNSKEFKENLLLKYMLPSIERIEAYDVNSGKSYYFQGKEKLGIVEALDKDIKEMRYEELNKGDSEYDIYIYNHDNRQVGYISIYTTDENVIKYIKRAYN